MLGLMAMLAAGCAGTSQGRSRDKVIVLDGAGWSGSAARIRAGLRAAGYRGDVESFSWTSLLGPGPDHFIVGHKKARGKALAEHIEQFKAEHPGAKVHLMGLSAGTAVVVFALEELARGVRVDNVVLFSPSISEKRDLSRALEHVEGRLYATNSPHDGILAGVSVTADGESGRAAGVRGLRMPSSAGGYEHYAKVVNLPWRPAYAGFGWNGGHTSVTRKMFVQRVIAPRVLSDLPHPLDRPLAQAETAAAN